MKKLFLSIIVLASIAFFASCNKTNSDGPGRLVVNVTDAPFPIGDIESATVTITKVEIRDAECDCPDKFKVISDDTVTFNLIDLRNGVIAELLDVEIPQGKYDLIRLYVEDAGLKIRDGGEHHIKVPSGHQTGIKIFIEPALVVDGGLTSEVLLDFDLSRSFVMRGNYKRPADFNGFIFKPVIRAVNNTKAGRLEGMVTDTAKVKIKEASVWVKQDTTVATTIADTLGHYVIIGVPAGTYTLYAAKENYDTLKVEGIKIVAGNRTIQDLILRKKK